jgi:hypothetical protein
MPQVFYTYDQDGNRIVEAKGDVRDAIVNIDPRKTPFYTLLAMEHTRDINPKTLEDSLDTNDDIDTLAQPQGGPMPEAQDTHRGVNSNWTQIFKRTVSVSNTQNQVAQYGIDRDEFKYQRAKKLTELKLLIEKVFISAQAKQEPLPSNGNVGKMAGIGALLTTHTNTSFDKAKFDTMIADIWADGGDPTLCLADVTRRAAINDWTGDRVTHETNDVHTLDETVEFYKSDVGAMVKIAEAHPYMPINSDDGNGPNVLLLDTAHVRERSFRDFHFQDANTSADAKEGAWVIETTLEEDAEQSSGQFYNL